MDAEKYTQEQRNEIADTAFGLHQGRGPFHVENYHPAVIGKCTCLIDGEAIWLMLQETDAHQRMVARSGPMQQVQQVEGSGLRKGRGDLI